MNKEQLKGSMKTTVGKVQQNLGQKTGSEKQQMKGAEKQVSGQAEKTVGDVKDIFNK